MKQSLLAEKFVATTNWLSLLRNTSPTENELNSSHNSHKSICLSWLSWLSPKVQRKIWHPKTFTFRLRETIKKAQSHPRIDNSHVLQNFRPISVWNTVWNHCIYLLVHVALDGVSLETVSLIPSMSLLMESSIQKTSELFFLGELRRIN